MASAPALVTLATERTRRGRALGMLGLAASLGAVIGPLAGGVARRGARLADRVPGTAPARRALRSDSLAASRRGTERRRDLRHAHRRRRGAPRASAGLADPPGIRRRERGAPSGERRALRDLAPRALLPDRPARLPRRAIGRVSSRSGRSRRRARRRSEGGWPIGASAGARAAGPGARGRRTLADRASRRRRVSRADRPRPRAGRIRLRALHRRQHALRDGRGLGRASGRGGQPRRPSCGPGGSSWARA